MAADTFVVNVRTLPDALESEMYPHLTRFQRKTSETRGPEFRFRCAPTETVGELKKRIEETRGYEVETLRRGGSPEGIVLEPDSATLAACGLDRSMSVWEHIWEDNAANQASFLRDREKIRDAVVDFMEEHPTVGRHGPEVTGEPEEFPKDWDAKKKKKRAEMEKAIASVREDNQRREAAALAKKKGKAPAVETPPVTTAALSA